MAEREAREAERHQKVVLDKMLDEEELTELRWPFRGCRGKVQAPYVAFVDSTRSQNTNTIL